MTVLRVDWKKFSCYVDELREEAKLLTKYFNSNDKSKLQKMNHKQNARVGQRGSKICKSVHKNVI